MLAGLTVDTEAPWVRVMHRDLVALVFGVVMLNDISIEYTSPKSWAACYRAADDFLAERKKG